MNTYPNANCLPLLVVAALLILMEVRQGFAQETDTTEGEVYTVIEEMPRIIGGTEALSRIAPYPEAAKEAGLEGTVYVQFTVNEEGNVIDPTVARGTHEVLNEAALAAVQKLEFEPGHLLGKPVNVRMALPFRFELPTPADSAGVGVDLLPTRDLWRLFAGENISIGHGEAWLLIRDPRLTAAIETVGVNLKREPNVLYLDLKPGTPDALREEIRSLVEERFGGDAEIVLK